MSDINDAVREAKRVEGSVLLSKHEDYGPLNISRAPGGPLNGLHVRMWDKLARAQHLHEKGVDGNHEAIQDTYLDLANYATIAGMVVRGEWPGIDVERAFPEIAVEGKGVNSVTFVEPATTTEDAVPFPVGSKVRLKDTYMNALFLGRSDAIGQVTEVNGGERTVVPVASVLPRPYIFLVAQLVAA